MAADATAASVYQGLVKNADPIGAFSAGVQLRSNLQKIDLAAQAGQMDTLLNIVKLQNDQADARIKEQLAKEQQQLAWYNAETNRINAMRPRTTSGSSNTSGYAMPQIIDHGDGSFDIAMPGEQAPTSGEGDMTMPEAGGVLPLTSGPEDASLLPMGGSAPVEPGMAPLPGMGIGRGMTVASASQPSGRQQPTGSHIPGMPDPFGTAPVAAQQPTVAGPSGMAQATTASTKKGKFEIGSFNPKTGSMSLRPIAEKDKEDAPVQPAPPEVLQKWSAIYDGFGKVAVPTTEKGFPQGFKFEDKPTLHGKDIGDLSADEQKRFGTMATELMTIARDMRMPTPEAKMAAVGVTDPAKMTEQLWKDGWNKVAGPGAADVLVMKATELAGFKNLMLGTNVHRPETILEQMGVDTAGMMPKQRGPAGGQVSVANSGQASADGTPGAPSSATQVAGMLQPGNLNPFNRKVLQNADGTSSTASTISIGTDKGEVLIPTVVDGKRLTESAAIAHYKKTGQHFGVFNSPESANAFAADLHNRMAASATGDDTALIARLESETAEEADPKIKAQKEAVIASLRARQQRMAAQKPSGSSTGGEERDAAGFIVRKPTQTVTPYETKRRAAGTQWEDNKQKAIRAMRDTLDQSEFRRLREGTASSGDPSAGIPSIGDSAETLRAQWVSKNAGKLGIKTKDGKPPKMDSVIFTDHEGREVKLREILDAVFADARFNNPESQTRASSGKSSGGNAYSVTVGKAAEVK